MFLFLNNTAPTETDTLSLHDAIPSSCTRGEMVTAEDILARLSAAHTLTPDTEERGSAPAERWLVDGGPATVGVIASVTRSFCGACDRTRLTADGQVRNCLFAREESDLRTP